MAQPRKFSIAPSDLSFLWEECRRCFYERRWGISKRPDRPFARIFNRIDGAMRRFYGGKSTAWACPTLPPGRLDCQERWISSAGIVVDGRQTRWWLNAKTDCIAIFDDETFGVIDFKTAEHAEDHSRYDRQLLAYAYCLEHPGEKSSLMSPVTRLGLLCVQPEDMLMQYDAGPSCLFRARPLYKPCPVGESLFTALMADVVGVLDAPEPPDANPDCPYCAYRRQGAAR